ncbi:MAG: hypothetical protein ABSC51_02865 [Gaiellaceae bacterium]|jgi:hypothetical protein
MAHDDWRIHVELAGESEPAGFLERLRSGLGDEAEELAKTLEGDRLAISRDGSELFAYASSYLQAESAHAVIEAELRRHGFEAKVSRVEHWLESEERWDDEPKGETWEEEEAEHGRAPWEVRVQCESHSAARDLAERLEGEGYRPVRRWRYLIVGADTREDAEKLARRLHGDVEAGGDVAWEEAADAGVISPFRIFG